MVSELLLRVMADGLVLPVAAAGVFAMVRWVPKEHRYQAYCRALMAGLTALLLAKLFATVYQPDELRPFVEMGVEPLAAYLDNPGFPSDHVLFAAAIALGAYFETTKRVLAYWLLGLTLLIAIGRVLALVHTPVDVIGGLVFAALGGLWYCNSEVRLAQLGHIFAKKS